MLVRIDVLPRTTGLVPGQSFRVAWTWKQQKKHLRMEVNKTFRTTGTQDLTMSVLGYWEKFKRASKKDYAQTAKPSTPCKAGKNKLESLPLAKFLFYQEIFQNRRVLFAHASSKSEFLNRQLFILSRITPDAAVACLMGLLPHPLR